MAEIIYDCQLLRGNTGQNRCSISPKPSVYHLLIPRDTVISAANLASFQTYLQARLIDNDPLLRWHLIGRMVGIENNTTERQSYEFQDGSSTPTRDQIYNWTYDHQNGFCWHQNMSAFDGAHTQYQAIQIDTQNVMWGVQALDASNLPTIAAFDMSDYQVPAMEMATFSDPTLYKLMMQVSDVSQLNQYGQQAKLGFNVSTMRGVQGVTLNDLGSPNWTTGVLNIAADTACGGLNLVTEMSAILDDPAAWVATNSVTGAVITITAVTALANGTGFAIDLDQTDGDYPTVGQGATINLASVSVLSGLGAKYFEGTEITIIRS